MTTFREILTADDSELVRIFYRVKRTSELDFLKKITHTATQLQLNHRQLVCALGFNPHVRDLTDILSLIGFSSYKLLAYRRNELFATDTYQQLDIDNIVDIYASDREDEELLTTLRELLPQRLDAIEAKLRNGGEPAMMISYKMEVNAIYASGIATAEFAASRIASPIADLRQRIAEIRMIVEGDLLPPANLFYADALLPEEKRYLLESGLIGAPMIQNRLANPAISEDERQMLEDFI